MMDNKQKAQKRADRIRSFSKELMQLENEQVVTFDASQKSAIDQYHEQLLHDMHQNYDIDITSNQKQFSLGMKIASFVGALALAIAVFFLFYQFWGYFYTWQQVSVLVAAPLLALFATEWVSRKEKTGYFAKLLSLLSFSCFVLNIAMLGQIFNITPSENALIVWAVFALLLAYAYDIRLLLAVGILCFAGFIAARTGTWSGMYWLSFGERPENFLIPAAIIFFMPVWLKTERYSGFAPIYRVFGSLFFLLPVLLLSNWGDGSYLSWDKDFIEGCYQLLGFSVSALLIVIGIRCQWAEVSTTGNIFFALFLYTKIYDWWWDSMPKYLFFLLIALLSILLLLVYKRLRSEQRDS